MIHAQVHAALREEKSHAQTAASNPPLQPPLTNIRGDAEQEAESATDPLLPCISSILELRSRGICAVTAASTQAGDCQGGFAVGLVIRRQVVSGVHFPRAMLTEAL